MPKLVDLTSTIDPKDRDLLPEAAKGVASIIAPTIDYLHPGEKGGKDQFCASLGCRLEDLPDGEGWGAELMNDFSSHCGTHVDAPLHSGSTSEGKTSRTITDISLDELFCPGVVLDVRAWAQPTKEITIDMLEKAIAAVEDAGGSWAEGCAAMIRTGQERYTIADPEYFIYPGMSRASTLHLIERGANVLGTDAVGWDRPFPVMRQTFEQTGDKSHLWDGHKAIVEREAFIVQKMANLGALPHSGFMVGFFPIKLARCSAAPARVVAFLND